MNDSVQQPTRAGEPYRRIPSDPIAPWFDRVRELEALIERKQSTLEWTRRHWRRAVIALAASRERERALRVMLAYAYGGALLYRDDGELQDNRTLPCIDFRRDSVEDIEAKMIERTRRAIATPDSAAEQGAAK